MLRGLVVVAAIIGAMVAVKDGRPLRDLGVVARCSSVATPEGQSGFWEACRAGKLEGRPNLTRRSCVSQGVAGELEFWRCPSRIATGAGN